ncbi:hypothetical protein LZ30DRAFT_777337 [Colletotrichum cereale]|nr:hypothetical protein LZ30DRAFT_777337 [Colletotrichum cereale]
MLVTTPLLVLATLVSADVAIFLTTGTWADTCPLGDLVPLDASNPSVAIPADLAHSDEKHGIPAARLNGTEPAIHRRGVVVDSTPSAIDMAIVAWMDTSARPTLTTQSSAGRRSAQPPALKPTGGYTGALAMTGLMCLVAFGIGSILGWIWPDGLRSEW